MLQKEFCAIGRKDADAVLGTFLEACLFKALRTNYPPPVRGAAIPPARTSCYPRLERSHARIQSSFARAPFAEEDFRCDLPEQALQLTRRARRRARAISLHATSSFG